MTRHERRKTCLLRARTSHPHHDTFSDNDPVPCDIEMHHSMSDRWIHYQDAFSFTKQSMGDPATAVCGNDMSLASFHWCKLIVCQNFTRKLKDHILGRLLDLEYDRDERNFSDEDRNTVGIVNNHIYSAKVLRINFTTYDVRRDQDSINQQTHCDVMVKSQEDPTNGHAFWYARVLGVFHVQVFHTGPLARNGSIQHIEFLWVRWFGIVGGYRYGPKVARLPKIGFLDETDESVFGFLDPSLVIRACHLVPAFADGRTTELLTTKVSLGRPVGETDDWSAF